MGYVEFDQSGLVIENVGQDSRPFGHIIENLRDSLLNGAQRVEFGFQGLTHKADEKGVLRPTLGPHVVRRTICDDGIGMEYDVLKNVYAKFGVSGTEYDFTVDPQPDASLLIGTTEYEKDDKYNRRRGMGGRATLYRFNRMGIVTVTVSGGESNMTWLFSTVEDKAKMRDFTEKDENGIRRKTDIVAPYTEPDVLGREDLVVDMEWSVQLLIRSGMFETATEAEKFIRSMSDEDEIPNPYAGISWERDRDILPDWIVSSWDEDTGVAYGPDGNPAHGTVKVLMGNSPMDSTAVTGDPFYRGVENDYTKVNGVGNQFWASLSDWDVRIHAVRPERHGRPGAFEIQEHPGSWQIDMAEGRRQDGAIPRRTTVTRTEVAAGLPSPNIWQGTLDLGNYGKAVVLLRHTNDKLGITTTAGSGLWGSTRGGIMAMAYGLELHGLYQPEKMESSKNALRLMGFPIQTKGQDDRISVVFFPPRIKVTPDGQTIIHNGVHQTTARDSLKWNGTDLPLSGNDGLFRAVAKALGTQAPDLLQILKDENETGMDSDVDVKDMADLFTESGEFIEQTQKTKRKIPSKSGGALISDPSGEHKGTIIGPQSSPGDEERPVCPECGKKIHDETCPNKGKSHGGGSGGTKGTKERLDPDKGRRRGRTSRARGRRGTKEEDVETTVRVPKETVNPPQVILQEQEDYDGGEAPAYWTRPATVLPDTGTIMVNMDHASFQLVLGYALKKVSHRDRDAVAHNAKQWIKDRLAEALLGYLMLKDKDLTAEGTGSKSTEDLAEWLVEQEEDGQFWVAVFATLFAARNSLRSYVTSKSAVDAEAA